jgi:hypothetical protein
MPETQPMNMFETYWEVDLTTKTEFLFYTNRSSRFPNSSFCIGLNVTKTSSQILKGEGEHEVKIPNTGG